MKKGTRFIVSILSILIFFVLFFGISHLTSPLPAREPAEGFATLKDEYISAIETFNSTGELVIPEGACFSYDKKQIIMKDTKTNYSLTCTFALNGTVPVYSWEDNSLPSAFYLVLLAFSIATAIGFYTEIEIKAKKQKFRKLNKIKLNSPDGDKRQKSTDCTLCYCRNDCSCPTCSYVKECGECFHSTCQADFKAKLHNEEDDSIFEANED